MVDAVTAHRIKETKRSARREVAELVYHYPQYTLQEAMDLPVGDRRLLLTYVQLRAAEVIREHLINLAASGSKPGFKQRMSDLKDVINQLTKQL
jgi:hypothetical protein